MQSEFMVKELLSNTTCNRDDLICVGDADNANANRHMKVSDFILRVKALTNEASGARVCTGSDAGTILCVTATTGTTTFTLPMASAVDVGSSILFIQPKNLKMVIQSWSVGGADICFKGVAANNSVTFGTASEMIGAAVEAIAISPTQWFLHNQSGCTATLA